VSSDTKAKSDIARRLDEEEHLTVCATRHGSRVTVMMVEGRHADVLILRLQTFHKRSCFQCKGNSV